MKIKPASIEVGFMLSFSTYSKILIGGFCDFTHKNKLLGSRSFSFRGFSVCSVRCYATYGGTNT